MEEYTADKKHVVLTSTFKMHHDGSQMLVSDVMEDYEEVRNYFEEESQKLFSNHQSILIPSGTYDVFITEAKYNKWGNRVKEVTIFNEIYDYEVNNLGFDNWVDKYTIGIDAGSCMFFSDDVLNNKLELDIFLEKWMSCQYDGNILKYEQDGKLNAFGVTSGFGDGIYNVNVYYDNDNIIGLYICFINDDEGEETGTSAKEYMGGYKNSFNDDISSSDNDDEENFDSSEDSNEDDNDSELK